MNRQLNILVVEEHDLLRQVTVDLLEREGHRVTGVESAEAVDDEGGQMPVDLLIVDLNLPGEDGLSLARRFRAAHPHAGVIIVTARTAVGDRVSGYESGADLYLGKPVEPRELQAAVAAIGRRLGERRAGEAAGEPAALVLESTRLRLRGRAEAGEVEAPEVELTAAEAAVLTGLARAAGQRLESWQILALLGEDTSSTSKGALEVRMVRLRKKLQQASADPTCLRAIRGWGYQLCTPIRVV